MTIDMDMPFAEFAEKHLKRQSDSNSGSLDGCIAALFLAAEYLATITSADGSGHADLALAVLKKAKIPDAEKRVEEWTNARTF